jgi:hypothetical protein
MSELKQKTTSIGMNIRGMMAEAGRKNRLLSPKKHDRP